MAQITHLKTGRQTLARLFQKNGFKIGAEIGVERGHYSKLICKLNPGVKLFCVDCWEVLPGYRDHVGQDRLDSFYNQTKEYLKDFDCTLIRKFSMDAVKDFEDGSLDFVYLDANHRFQPVAEDIVAWAKKVRVGGIVAGHDYVKEKDYGVIEAVNVYAEVNNLELFICNGDQSPSWYFIKK